MIFSVKISRTTITLYFVKVQENRMAIALYSMKIPTFHGFKEPTCVIFHEKFASTDTGINIAF